MKDKAGHLDRSEQRVGYRITHYRFSQIIKNHNMAKFNTPPTAQQEEQIIDFSSFIRKYKRYWWGKHSRGLYIK